MASARVCLREVVEQLLMLVEQKVVDVLVYK